MQNRDTTVGFRLSEEEKAILKKVCEKEGVTMSELIRRSIYNIVAFLLSESDEEREERIIIEANRKEHKIPKNERNRLEDLLNSEMQKEVDAELQLKRERKNSRRRNRPMREDFF